MDTVSSQEPPPLPQCPVGSRPAVAGA